MKFRIYLLAFLLGVMATLTLPPVYLFPLVIPAYGGLYYLLTRAENVKRAARIGFFWGWGFYMTGLYWFVIALMTDPDKFAWLIPFALFALTAVIALYTTFFAVLFYGALSFLRKQESCRNLPRAAYKIPAFAGMTNAILFAALWTCVEYARGHLFTGFPWNLGGYVFAASDASIQLGAVFGIYGLTFITALLGVLCFAHKRAAVAAWLLLAIGIGWGQQRAQNAPHAFVEGVKLRLVQADIEQHHKWDPALQMQGLREHIAIMRAPGFDKITHIIWPETAVPYVLTDDSTLAVRLGETLLPGQYLITGALRKDDKNIYNSIAVIDAQGAVVGHYNKHKLVPFGEFLPLREFIPSALETPVGMTDLGRGEGTQTLDWPGLPPVSPLICYEVVFPGEAVAKDRRPGWLLSVTNDAWFGHSSAPYQHLAAARMRAVEEGLPMVRAANTGISAVFDAYGREVARMELGSKGFVDVDLPAPAK